LAAVTFRRSAEGWVANRQSAAWKNRRRIKRLSCLTWGKLDCVLGMVGTYLYPVMATHRKYVLPVAHAAQRQGSNFCTITSATSLPMSRSRHTGWELAQLCNCTIAHPAPRRAKVNL
jgi:hypothetical protein